DEFFAAGGITFKDEGQPKLLATPDGVADVEIDGARGIAEGTFAFFRACQLRTNAEAPDQKVYENMFRAMPGDQVSGFTYGLITWFAIRLGRRLNSGKVMRGGLLDDATYRNVVPMNEPGWYPNPMNAGEIIGGDATRQRYWDGDRWTDRARKRQGRKWQ